MRRGATQVTESAWPSLFFVSMPAHSLVAVSQIRSVRSIAPERRNEPPTERCERHVTPLTWPSSLCVNWNAFAFQPQQWISPSWPPV